VTIIDTPEGIAFARAAARAGALDAELRAHPRGSRILRIVREVYNLPGKPAEVASMLHEYVDASLDIRSWDEARGRKAQATAQWAIERAEEEHPEDPNLKTYADSNIQMLFDNGAITEDEGNDASTLLFVEVIRSNAGTR